MCPRTDCTKKLMPSELRVFSGRPRWWAMTTTQHVIKWSTACAVVGVAAIAAVASNEHAYALVRVHGEAGRTGRLVPLTVDGLIYAWPAIALVGSYELLMMVIRGSQAAFDDTSDSRTTADPLQEQAAQVFAEQLAADRVPSIRTIRVQLHVGQPRAQRQRDYLAAEASRLAIPGTEAVSQVAGTLPDGSSCEPPSSRWRRPDAALHEGDARIS